MEIGNKSYIEKESPNRVATLGDSFFCLKVCSSKSSTPICGSFMLK